MSASPVLQPSLHVRSHRLALIAQCHHIPRVQSLKSLEKMKKMSRGEESSRDSGQDTLTDSSEISSDTSDMSSVLVDTSEEDTKIVHRYIASRGQRERETDIYEVNPPPPLLTADI